MLHSVELPPSKDRTDARESRASFLVVHDQKGDAGPVRMMCLLPSRP